MVLIYFRFYVIIRVCAFGAVFYKFGGDPNEAREVAEWDCCRMD